jgi:hypothetical protein
MKAATSWCPHPAHHPGREESAYDPAGIIKRQHRNNIAEIRQFAQNWALRISKINRGDNVSVRGKLGGEHRKHLPG